MTKRTIKCGQNTTIKHPILTQLQCCLSCNVYSSNIDNFRRNAWKQLWRLFHCQELLLKLKNSKKSENLMCGKIKNFEFLRKKYTWVYLLKFNMWNMCRSRKYTLFNIHGFIRGTYVAYFLRKKIPIAFSLFLKFWHQ